ncbi:MAG: chromate transporter [Deltaproteobacteria bacterium]|nr:MAG: chromate transporter [Deltaproteobacteria bacterium]TMB15712.1 MAG: chromate transporter [Deltaproteobacteria bacterium]
MSEPGPRPTAAALALAFLVIALASFGGGLSAWAQRVLVEQRRWLEEDEFLSALTLCRLMPGPNQVNMAVYVGARFRGLVGALASVVGLVLVPSAILLGLGAAYFRYRHLPLLDAGLRGAVAAAAAMTLAMGVKVGTPLVRDRGAIALAVAAFVGVHVLRLPLVGVVAVLGPVGILWAWPRAAAEERS